MPAPTYDSIYNNDIAANRAGYDTVMAGIGLDRSRLTFDTGFNQAGSIDLSNPYNQAMMLQRHWEQGQRATTNAMGAQGLYYSRARQRSLDEGSFQYERNRSNLQTSAQRAHEDLTLEERRARDALTAGEYGAKADQAERWRTSERDWYERYG
jgi:hypothetical protein